MDKRIQAKNISDLEILKAIKEEFEKNGFPHFFWTEGWKGFPPKVVLSKCAALLKRGLLDGCDCGCRGDWILTDKGKEFLAVTQAVIN